MLRKSFLCFLISLLGIAVYSQSPVRIIPQPVDISIGCCHYSIGRDVRIKGNISREERHLFSNLIRNELSLYGISRNDGEISTIRIKVGTNATSLQHPDSYTIDNTNGSTVSILANSNAAAFYAVQSLVQLIDERGMLQSCTLSDYPRFPYRGVMLDCSRHFFDKDFILRQIDALARYKFSYLHLHLTDAAGWRIESKCYPELTRLGAFRTESDWNNWWISGEDRKYASVEAKDYLLQRNRYNQPASRPYGGYYTQQELREIVEYAAKRHITVIPEIEMPGHSEEVIAALPHLACDNLSSPSGAFCVGNEETFVFLENVLTEVMDIFPSKLIHIGGDEVSREHWEQCSRCQKRMRDESLSTTAQLQSYLTHRIEKFLNAHGRTLLGWDEILEGELAPNAVVMSWRGTEGGIKAANAQHHAIMSPGGFCYFDSYQDAPATQPRAFGGYTPLYRTYSFEPVSEELTANGFENYIDGIQGNVWAEMIETPQHMEYMLWPRALAISEIGWSTSHDDYDNFRERAVNAVSYLHCVGINAFDLSNEIGQRPESKILTEHEAIGKPVEYLAPYADVYRASGDSSLVDGLSGDWSYGDGRWQGFITRDRFHIVIDMLSDTQLHDISLNFMQFAGPEIFAPAKVEIACLSSDGTTTPLFQHEYDVSRATDYFIRNVEWRGNAVGRYVIVKASAGKYGGWIFTDEVFVNKK